MDYAYEISYDMTEAAGRGIRGVPALLTETGAILDFGGIIDRHAARRKPDEAPSDEE